MSFILGYFDFEGYLFKALKGGPRYKVKYLEVFESYNLAYGSVENTKEDLQIKIDDFFNFRQYVWRENFELGLDTTLNIDSNNVFYLNLKLINGLIESEIHYKIYIKDDPYPHVVFFEKIIN